MGKMGAVVRVHENKIKQNRQFSHRYNHNYRKEKIENANTDMTHQNLVLKEPKCKTYLATFEEREQSLPYYETHKLRSNAVRGIEFLCALTDGDAPKDFVISEWANKCLDFLERYYGKENVIDGVLHMDEHTPHLHAMVLPVKDGRFCCKDFLGGPTGLRKMQQAFDEEVTQPMGLKRRQKGSVSKHKDIKRYYKDLNMRIEDNLPAKLENETVEEYQKRANEYFKDARLSDMAKIYELKSKRESEMTTIKNLKISLAKSEKKIEKAISSTGVLNLEELLRQAICFQTLQMGLNQIENKEEKSELEEMLVDLMRQGSIERNKEMKKEEVEV